MQKPDGIHTPFGIDFSGHCKWYYMRFFTLLLKPGVFGFYYDILRLVMPVNGVFRHMRHW
jgi:hypothetical protein